MQRWYSVAKWAAWSNFCMLPVLVAAFVRMGSAGHWAEQYMGPLKFFVAVLTFATVTSVLGMMSAWSRRRAERTFCGFRGLAGFHAMSFVTLAAVWWFGHESPVSLLPFWGDWVETTRNWFGAIRIPRSLRSDEELIPFHQRRMFFGHTYWDGDGICDRSGKIQLPPIYKSIHPYAEGRAVVVDAANRHGVLGNDGRFIVEPKFESLGMRYFEKRLQVRISGRWGYLDENGEVVIEPAYDQATFFVNGLARVNMGGQIVSERQLLDVFISFRGGRYGYIDRSGRLVIPCQFLEGSHFSQKGAEVTLEDGSRWLIDRNGDRISQIASDDAASDN